MELSVEFIVWYMISCVAKVRCAQDMVQAMLTLIDLMTMCMQVLHKTNVSPVMKTLFEQHFTRVPVKVLVPEHLPEGLALVPKTLLVELPLCAASYEALFVLARFYPTIVLASLRTLVPSHAPDWVLHTTLFLLFAAQSKANAPSHIAARILAHSLAQINASFSTP